MLGSTRWQWKWKFTECSRRLIKRIQGSWRINRNLVIVLVFYQIGILELLVRGLPVRGMMHTIIIYILYFEEGMKKKSLTSYCLVEKCFPLQQYLRSMLNDNSWGHLLENQHAHVNCTEDFQNSFLNKAFSGRAACWTVDIHSQYDLEYKGKSTGQEGGRCDNIWEA